MHISEGIRNMKEHESASWMLHDVVPIFVIRPEIERLWAVKSWGKVGPHGAFLQQKAL